MTFTNAFRLMPQLEALSIGFDPMLGSRFAVVLKGQEIMHVVLNVACSSPCRDKVW